MHRVMFTIVSASSGWQLFAGGEGRQWFVCRDHALEVAGLMAASLHEHHGIPTAVIVDMVGRESVMLACHG